MLSSERVGLRDQVPAIQETTNSSNADWPLPQQHTDGASDAIDVADLSVAMTLGRQPLGIYIP
jgi:hypothetical protein